MASSSKIGFIGGGAMAEAIIAGLRKSDVIPAEAIYVSDHKAARTEELCKCYGIHACVGADTFLDDVTVLVLAVKPQAAQKALAEVSGRLRGDALVLSIVAGLTLREMERAFSGHPIVRIMPNTPLAVGAGMSVYSCGTHVTSPCREIVEQIFSSAGRVVEVKESAMDAVTGLSGSGPAFAFLMIDALASGGIAAGLPAKTARLLAAQTIFGAAKMVLETETHPEVLRDAVTSPAGTTIAGVRVMEQRGVRGALMDAVLAASARSEELGK